MGIAQRDFYALMPDTLGDCYGSKAKFDKMGNVRVPEVMNTDRL
jgi:hypothetical protein